MGRAKYNQTYIYDDFTVERSPDLKRNPLVSYYREENEGWTHMREGDQESHHFHVDRNATPEQLERILELDVCLAVKTRIESILNKSE